MASELYVETLKGLTSGANANKVIIPAGQTLYAPGHVIQAVSTTKTSVFDTTSTSLTDITGLSVSITPSSASSKILVMATLMVSGTNYEHYLQLVRGSTAIAQADAAGSRPVSTLTTYGYTGQTWESRSAAMSFLDSPSTTSSTTYKVQVKVQSGGSFKLNRTERDTDSASNDGRGVSTITLMEIAG